MANVKLLLVVSLACVVALLVGSGIQHHALRESRLKRKNARNNHDDADQGAGVAAGLAWWAPAKVAKDGTLGENIRKVANDIEHVHRSINKLAKELPTLPPGEVADHKAKKKAAKRKDGRGGEGEAEPVKKGPPITSPPHPVANYDESIFVSIASYRDEQCAPTVFDMYDKAQNPKALFVGIVEQNMKDDLTCMPKEFQDCQLSAFCPSDQIQMRNIEPKDAKGPTYGRYIGMLMYRNEKYFMLIDSHNRFVTHWDNLAINMLNRLPTKKGVLSHYPEAWHNVDDKGPTNLPLDNRKTTTYLCTAKFVEQGYPRLDGFIVHTTKNPREQPWAAAGFLFTHAKILQEIPFDPYLNYVFDGEEILYSIRMWTHGWDIFSPNENILYHYYYRTKAKKFWSLLPPDWTMQREKAHRRIQWYLGVKKKGTDERLVPLDTTDEWVLKENEKYGLGKDRTLEAWYAYAGVDPKERKIENKFCPKA